MRALIFIMCLWSFCSQAQFMSKKESAAIDKILNDVSKKNKPQSYLIKNVSVLTMKSAGVLSSQSVLIENGLIKRVAPEIHDTNAVVIDGSGKYLMPGLTDMHVHLFDRHQMKNTWMLMLLINGVTTVRDMCGEAGKIQLREKIKTNEILGPNLYQAGPIIDGKKENLGLFAFAGTPEQGREIVQAQKKAGYDLIKVYDGLSRDVYVAIVDEGRKQGLHVTGHLPDQVTIDEAIDQKQNTIEHLTGYFEWKDNQVNISVANDYAKTANSEIWNCPTLYNHFMNGSRPGAREMMAYAEGSGLLPQGLREHWSKIINNNSKVMVEVVDKYGPGNYNALKQIVVDLHKSGAKLIAGTDAGSLPLLIPGYSLHQELKHMSDLGITNFDVLKMATINAAKAMGRESEFGTIEEGKRADLLLLDESPLEDISKLQDKAGVMVRGVWLSKEELDRITGLMRSAFKP